MVAHLLGCDPCRFTRLLRRSRCTRRGEEPSAEVGRAIIDIGSVLSTSVEGLEARVLVEESSSDGVGDGSQGHGLHQKQAYQHMAGPDQTCGDKGVQV